MRLTMDRRWLTALLAAALVAGCNSKPNSGGGSGGTKGEPSGAKGGPGPIVANGPTGRQQAEAFLKDLGEGKAAADRLTSAFKKKLAPPGKDVDVVAKEWLDTFKGGSFVIGEEAKVGDAVAVRGLAKFPDKSMAFSLRLVNGQADWLHRSERQGAEIKVPADASMAAAQDVIRNFLDLLLGGDLKQAHSLMTTTWKKSLSPPGPQDIKDGYDFGPGFLAGKTRAWKDDYLSYTLTPTDHGSSKDTVVFVATMDAGNKKDKHTVKATKDPTTGEWLVSDFEKQ
jgi:hypothetical protein